jgi:hypothetical protein
MPVSTGRQKLGSKKEHWLRYQDARRKRVRFFNKTTLADVTDANVDVFLLNGDNRVRSIPLCKTFVLSGRLWIDCAPELNRKYTAPVPQDVLISRNEDCLSLGRYGVFVPAGSELGKLVRDLLDVALRGSPNIFPSTLK